MGSINIFVMSFELANVPGTFISLMNKVFKPFLDSFVIVFIDDILVYSKSKKSMPTIFVLFRVSLENKSYMQNFPSVNFGWSRLYFWGMRFQKKE